MGACKRIQFLQPPLAIIKVYTEALTEFTDVYYPDTLNITFLSQGYILGAASGTGEGKWNAHFKDKILVGSLQLPSSASLVNQQSHLLDDLLNTGLLVLFGYMYSLSCIENKLLIDI